MRWINLIFNTLSHTSCIVIFSSHCQPLPFKSSLVKLSTPQDNNLTFNYQLSVKTFTPRISITNDNRPRPHGDADSTFHEILFMTEPYCWNCDFTFEYNTTTIAAIATWNKHAGCFRRGLSVGNVVCVRQKGCADSAVSQHTRALHGATRGI